MEWSITYDKANYSGEQDTLVVRESKRGWYGTLVVPALEREFAWTMERDEFSGERVYLFQDKSVSEQFIVQETRRGSGWYLAVDGCGERENRDPFVALAQLLWLVS